MPVNKTVLRWAREQTGKTIEDVAHALNQAPSLILAWEDGVGGPTFAQLETLAYSVYKRPTAIFFFPEPPREAEGKIEFRTLPAADALLMHPDTRLATRQAILHQLSLSEIYGERNPAADPIFNAIEIKPAQDIKAIAHTIRSHLGVPIETQLSWRSTADSFDKWRTVFETSGVYTVKRAFKDNTISGFCVLNDTFPLIVVNNSHTFSRQVYTLFHELAHILIGEAGITLTSTNYVGRIADPRMRQIETWCNALAAEALVPSAIFNQRYQGDTSDEAVGALADQFHVSREVILRRLLERNAVTQQYYEVKALKWNEERRNSEKPSKGGNFYHTHMAYLGRKFVTDVFRSLIQQRATEAQAADFLSISPTKLAKLATYAGFGDL